MRRVSSAIRVFAVLILFSLASLCALAQRMKPADSDADQDTDRAAERLMWFLEGRLTPDGKPSAEKAQKAHERKMSMRAEQARQLMQSANSNATVTVGGTTTQWTPMGPAPILTDGLWGQVTGRIAAVYVDQSDTTGNTVLVGGAFGGVWRSLNAASADPTQVTWTPLIDAQATLAVGAITQKPDNHNVILVGTGEAKSAIDSYYGRGILRSTDGGASWTQVTQTAEGVQFLGLGFARFAWSTTNTNLVVAATTSTAVGNRTGAVALQGAQSGLFYSTDAGATWHKAAMQDGGQNVAAAAHSVVFNPAMNKFYAAIRFHGLYESSNGQTFTRMATQPDGSNLSTANCPANIPTGTNPTCPIYRGELFVVPNRNEMYLWYTSATGDAVASNRGAFYTVDGGSSWRTLNMTGMNTCGDSQGCGASQGYFYNMAIAAVPVGAQTDLYLGAVNVFKCRINPADPSSLCSGSEPNKFMNLTHVYGSASTCGWGGMATFHPDNQSYDFSTANPDTVYFGTDGGMYRTLTSQNITTGVCSTTKQPFQNLNNASLSLTQFVWGSAHPADATQFMAGAQDNGTSMTFDAVKGANGQNWKPILSGDGGYNAFRPDNPTTLIASYVNANMYICSGGTNCSESGFNQFIAPGNLTATGTTTADSTPFYTVWELDKRQPTKIVIGSCRVWRVNASAPFTGAPISPKLSNASGSLACTTGDVLIYSIATGGPAGANGVATVVYAGLNDGAIWRTSNADAATPTWTNVTPALTINPGPTWSSAYPGFRVSSIAMDAGDATGNTAYATIQGFATAHVLKTTNGGATWSSITGNLPDAPANSITVDPDDSTVVYVGTDVGVFVTSNGGTTWTEVGTAGSSASYLPNVVVTRVLINKIATSRTLYAVTYGRGVWKADISTPSGPPNASLSATSLDWGKVNVNSSPANKTFTITNTGASTLTIASIVNFGYTSEYGVTHNCGSMPVALAGGASCTVTVSFHPTTTGTHNATLVVTSDSGGTAGDQKVVTLAGTAEDFGTPVVSNTTVTVAKGATADFGTVTIPAVTGGFSSAITMSCSGLPTGAQCVFSLNPIPAPNSASAATNMTITTKAATAASASSLPTTRNPLLALWLALPGMALLVPANAAGKNRKRLASIALALLCLGLVISAIGCGGASGGSSSGNPPLSSATPSGTYTVTVNASNGTLSHSTTVTLTVQ